jgi:hypothetical protein
MARAKKAATHDVIDRLVEKLNEIEGIEFVRDAWLNKAPDNYGVVEFTGDVNQLWADGHLIDTVWRVIVSLYVKGDDDTWPGKVQAKLEDLEEDGTVDTTHTISREFDYQIGKVRWTWQVSLYGELVQPEGVDAG